MSITGKCVEILKIPLTCDEECIDGVLRPARYTHTPHSVMEQANFKIRMLFEQAGKDHMRRGQSCISRIAIGIPEVIAVHFPKITRAATPHWMQQYG